MTTIKKIGLSLLLLLSFGVGLLLSPYATKHWVISIILILIILYINDRLENGWATCSGCQECELGLYD